MKKCFALFGAFAMVGFLATSGRADVIYNVDFENPPHVVDQPVVTGSGSDTPSGADPSVIVRTGVADFTTQVASLEPAGAMNFFSATPSSTDIALISWDLAMLSFGTGGGPDTAAIAIQSSAAGSIIVDFRDDFDIQVGGVSVGSFTLAQQDTFLFAFDLNSDMYDFSLNGSPVLTDQPLGSSFDIQNVLFSRENLENPSYAVDNFQWTVIPEPSTIVLMLLALGGLALGRIRR